MQLTIHFYTEHKSKIGPVELFLEKLVRKNKSLWAKTISGINKLKHRQYHKEPLSKSLGDNLWELRVKSENNILRIIYAFQPGREIYLLHGFIKKTQKTPAKELKIAKQRLRSLYEKN